jgi:hypothetical protein
MRRENGHRTAIHQGVRISMWRQSHGTLGSFCSRDAGDPT